MGIEHFRFRICCSYPVVLFHIEYVVVMVLVVFCKEKLMKLFEIWLDRLEIMLICANQANKVLERYEIPNFLIFLSVIYLTLLKQTITCCYMHCAL